MRTTEEVVRPPWSLPDPLFQDQCTQCNDCSTICPTRIISRDNSGYPVVSFDRGECLFCGDCVLACTSGALSQSAFSNDAPAWCIKAEFSDACLANKEVVCRVCSEQCEQEAIIFKLTAGQTARPSLQIDQCNGCGACVSPCPTRAVQLRVPAH